VVTIPVAMETLPLLPGKAPVFPLPPACWVLMAQPLPLPTPLRRPVLSLLVLPLPLPTLLRSLTLLLPLAICWKGYWILRLRSISLMGVLRLMRMS
jgi:hypothetical protein